MASNRTSIDNTPGLWRKPEVAPNRTPIDNTPGLWRKPEVAPNRNSIDNTPGLWRKSLHDQGLPNEWHARARADHEQQQQEEAATGAPVSRSNTPAREECSLTRPDCMTKTCIHWKRKSLRNSWLATPPNISEFSPEYQQKHMEMQKKREHDADILAATRRSLGYGYDTAEQDDFMEHFKADEGKLPLEPAPDDTSSRRPSSADKAARRSRYSTFSLDDSLSDIPQRYFDEADRMWHEWDEDNDADQYMADIMRKAPWREVHREEPASDFGILPSAHRLRYTYTERDHESSLRHKYTEHEHEPSRRKEEGVVSTAPRFPYNEREYEPPRREEEMGSRWSESTSALGDEGKDDPAVWSRKKWAKKDKVKKGDDDADVPQRRFSKLGKKDKVKKGDDDADVPQRRFSKLGKKDKVKKGDDDDDADVPQRRLSMKKLKDGIKRLSGIR